MDDNIDMAKLLTVARAAQGLGLSKMTVYRWARAKEIKSREIDGILFILQDEVDRIKAARAPRGKELSSGGAG